LLADLDALLAVDEPLRAAPLPKLPPRGRAWRRPAALLGGILAVAALAAGGWYVFGPPRSSTTRASTRSSAPSRPTVTNSVGMELASVPPGRFVMGDATVPDGRPPHPVQISRPFLIGTTEVTQAQYKLVVGDNPSQFPGDTRPVDSVTWDEANTFCEKLTARAGEQSAGRLYRLPTEAEWEYACRAGTETAFSLGPTLPGTLANTGRSGIHATLPVGTFSPNPWGLYDVHGNVWEWCRDWYGTQQFAVSKATDPTGPQAGTRRVARGGSWETEPAECRSASRGAFAPDERSTTLGFRVICVVSGGMP
jgi:formylglycine-generating enzyme required for sulfatase activity